VFRSVGVVGPGSPGLDPPVAGTGSAAPGGWSGSPDRRRVAGLGGRRSYRSLEENQKVEFEVTQGPKGPQASGIRAL